VSWPEAPTDINADLDEYLTAYTAAWDEQQNRTRTAEALDAVVGACERTMQSVIGDTDLLLQALAGDFDELMDHLRETVSRLNGAANANEAINAGTAESWRELPALRREYDQLRHAQELVMLDAPVMNHRSAHVDDPLADDIHVGNLDAVFPTWRPTTGSLSAHPTGAPGPPIPSSSSFGWYGSRGGSRPATNSTRCTPHASAACPAARRRTRQPDDQYEKRLDRPLSRPR
jgi:hypothetical protein